MGDTSDAADKNAFQPGAWHFVALLGGNVALALGPWLVRLADTGPVSAGFWRLFLPIPLIALFAWREKSRHPIDRRVALLHSNSTTSAYLGELLLGALAEAPQRHLHLVVEQCAPGASAQEVVDQVAQAHVAGVILPPPLCDWSELVDLLTQRDIAVVAIALWQRFGQAVTSRITEGTDAINGMGGS